MTILPYSHIRKNTMQLYAQIIVHQPYCKFTATTVHVYINAGKYTFIDPVTLIHDYLYTSSRLKILLQFLNIQIHLIPGMDTQSTNYNNLINIFTNTYAKQNQPIGC